MWRRFRRRLQEGHQDVPEPPHLRGWAEAFAVDLNRTFHGVLDSAFPPFEAVLKAGGDTRLVVQPKAADPVPLHIDGEHALNFSIAFHCVWDSSSQFLKIAKAESLASIHFPVGGPRFRPCVEDVLQLLICELGVDHKKATAMKTIEKGREEWRRRQIRAVVRDAPSEAVAALEAMGYRVGPPEAGPAPDNGDPLTRV